jgi:hypothetical protein
LNFGFDFPFNYTKRQPVEPSERFNKEETKQWAGRKMGGTLTANFFLPKFGNKRTIQKQKTCTLFQPQDHLTQDLHKNYLIYTTFLDNTLTNILVSFTTAN